MLRRARPATGSRPAPPTPSSSPSESSNPPPLLPPDAALDSATPAPGLASAACCTHCSTHCTQPSNAVSKGARQPGPAPSNPSVRSTALPAEARRRLTSSRRVNGEDSPSSRRWSDVHVCARVSATSRRRLDSRRSTSGERFGHWMSAMTAVDSDDRTASRMDRFLRGLNLRRFRDLSTRRTQPHTHIPRHTRIDTYRSHMFM